MGKTYVEALTERKGMYAKADEKGNILLHYADGSVVPLLMKIVIEQDADQGYEGYAIATITLPILVK